MERGAFDALADGERGEQAVAPRDGVQQGDLLEPGAVLIVQVVLDVVQQPVGAGGRVDDDRHLAVPAPLPQRIAGGGGHPLVPPEIALAAPRGGAALARDVAGNPQRLTGPRRDLDQGLRQAWVPGLARVTAEDPVDAGREVHRGGALPGGAGQLAQLGARHRAGDGRDEVVADHQPGCRGQPGQHSDPQGALDDVGRADRGAGELFPGRPPPGDQQRGLLPPGGRFGAAERLLQRAGVDLDRARDRAAAVHRAGLDAVVLVLVLQPGQQRRPLGLAGHLPAQHDPLPRGGGDVATGAHRLAEAAFDAVRGGVLDRRRGLERLQVDAVVAGQDHVRRQDAAGVGELLDPPHHVGGLVAPLVADERRHVDTGAVLGLERAVVLVDDQRDQIGHERRVPLPVGLLAEAGGQGEVQVAVGRVPGGVRQEAVLGQQVLQILGALGDAVRREAHVLDDQGGPFGAPLSDDAEEPVADPPVQLDLILVPGEFHRVDQVRAGRQRGGLGYRGVERGWAVRAELDQQPRGGGIEAWPVLRGAREGLRGRDQRGSEHELHRFGAEPDQAGDQRGGFTDRRQHDPADRGHGRRRNGTDHGLGHERERALGPDDEPAEDFQRGIPVEQGRQRVAVGVADGVLMAHPLRERVVGEKLFAQLHQAFG